MLHYLQRYNGSGTTVTWSDLDLISFCYKANQKNPAFHRSFIGAKHYIKNTVLKSGPGSRVFLYLSIWRARHIGEYPNFFFFPGCKEFLDMVRMRTTMDLVLRTINTLGKIWSYLSPAFTHEWHASTGTKGLELYFFFTSRTWGQDRRRQRRGYQFVFPSTEKYPRRLFNTTYAATGGNTGSSCSLGCLRLALCFEAMFNIFSLDGHSVTSLGSGCHVQTTVGWEAIRYGNGIPGETPHNNNYDNFFFLDENWQLGNSW